MKRFLLAAILFSGLAHAQIALPYYTQTGDFNALRTANTNENYFAGAFNNGGSELGTYANGGGGTFLGNPGVAVFRTFNTEESGTSGSAVERAMQVGDEFTITAYVGNSSSFFDGGTAGISFNGGTTYTSLYNYNTLQRAKFQISKNGLWYGQATNAGGGNWGAGSDVVLRIKLTSEKTVNIQVGTNGAGYDLRLENSPGASGNIRSFAIWNQSSGSDNNMYWKNASLTNTKTVEIGGGNGTSTFDGAITNGLVSNSTSVASGNSVIKSGTGIITFSANNTYTGSTRVNAGTLRLSGSGTFGIGSQVYISQNATLDLNSVNATVASVQETGTGNGGVVTLGSATLTMTGGFSGTRYQNSISGTGSIVKQGTGILSLYGTQNYTGSTTVSGGELSTGVAMASASYTINGGAFRIAADNLLPDNATITLSSGTFYADYNETINNLSISGGSLLVAAGKTLTVNGTVTLSGAATITLGAGASIKYGSNATLIYNGGTLTASAEWPSTFGPASVTVNSGDVTLDGNKTIAADLTITAGTLNLGTYTANRLTAGGTLTLGPGAVLSIGGTNGLPANYAAHAIDAGSTIEYSGTAQVVEMLNSSQEYGILKLSGTGQKILAGPTIAEDMIIETGADLLVTSGQSLTVKGDLQNNGGTVVFENNANLVQAGATNTNTGAVTVHRNSSLLYRGDYTLWSSPVAGQELEDFSPETVITRFYTYNPATDYYESMFADDAAAQGVEFETGTGYLIRMPNGAPQQGYVEGNTAIHFDGTFEGVPNSGDITVGLTQGAQGYNAVGNPYPSPISIPAFFAANNTGMYGALYFWRKTNGSAGAAYATATNDPVDFVPAGDGSDNPNGIIQAGQGFIVQTLGAANLFFTNDMRSASVLHDDSFFRMANNSAAGQIEGHRIRLKLKNDGGTISQMLVGYKSNATMGLDNGIDAKYIGEAGASLNSLLNNDAYVIQGRALPFNAQDVVPLQFKAGVAGNYTIALDYIDGLFAGGQDIFIKDNVTAALHNIKESDYSFASEEGTFNERFEIVYAQALGTDTPEANTDAVIAYKKGSGIMITSGTIPMSDVAVYDVQGRMIYNEVNSNGTSLEITTIQPQQQLLIVQITTPKGKVSRKIVF